jgi:hypothetical protein
MPRPRVTDERHNDVKTLSLPPALWGHRGLTKVGADMDLDDRLDARLPGQADSETEPRDLAIDHAGTPSADRGRTVAEAIAAADQRDLAAVRRDRAARARDDEAMRRDFVAVGHRDAGLDHDTDGDREAAARDRQASLGDRHFAALDRDEAAGDRALLHQPE